MKPFTGGKALASRLNLFRIHVSASRTGDGRPANYWSQDATETGIASESIRVFGWPLGSDGNLFLTFRDNSTNDFTVDTPYNNYTFDVSQTKHRFYIFANGYLLADDRVRPQANYIVGQYLKFTNAFNPPLPSGTQKGPILWEFNGTFYNDGTNAVPGVSWPTCSSNYFQNPNLLTNETTTAWWVSGGNPAQYHAHIGEYLTFANGQELAVTAKGLFSMYRPDVQITAVGGAVSIGTNVLWDTCSNLKFGLNCGLPSQCGGTDGIWLSNYTTLLGGFSGSVKWFQVITHTTIRYQDATNQWWRYEHANCLDKGMPTNSNPYRDSPGSSIDPGTKALSMSANFDTWLMFQPTGVPPGVAWTGGQWVPLQKVNWTWSGEGAEPNWTLVNPVNPSPIVSDPIPNYPHWTNIIKKPGPLPNGWPYQQEP